MIDDTKVDSDDWLKGLFSSPIFQRLSPINLQKIMMNFEGINFTKDEVILDQGSSGNYYYLIKSGQCLCTRKSSQNAKKIKIRQLGPGDTFGEDALISDGPRDLTITALTDISLLRLDKQQFLSLIKEPSIKFINYKEIQGKADLGAVLLDVRTPEEYFSHHLKGSINAPFFSLRMKIKTLNREKLYIVVCAEGKISEAAVYLLLNHNFEAKVLKNGMAGVVTENIKTLTNGRFQDCL